MTKPHPIRVSEYLEHIYDAIDRASAYVHDLPNAEAFENAFMARDAVVRNIEIVGEASTKILKADPRFVSLHPEIPWQQMSAMRNRMIHDYFEVDYEIVWRTVKEDLPRLGALIKAIVQSLPQ